MIGGLKYMFLSATDRVVRAKKGTSGIHAIKTVQALILCVYEDPVVPEQAATVTEKLGEYLISVGYWVRGPAPPPERLNWLKMLALNLQAKVDLGSPNLIMFSLCWLGLSTLFYVFQNILIIEMQTKLFKCNLITL